MTARPFLFFLRKFVMYDRVACHLDFLIPCVSFLHIVGFGFLLITTGHNLFHLLASL